jgi:hypothetical protein
VVAAVVLEFSSRQIFTPFLWLLECHAPQVLLHTLVNSFCLAIRLRVIDCGEMQRDFQGRKNLLPKFAEEDNVPVCGDDCWWAMKFDNIVDEQISHSLDSVWMREWKEVAYLLSLSTTTRITFFSFRSRPPFNKVHTNFRPFSLGNVERFPEPWVL